MSDRAVEWLDESEQQVWRRLLVVEAGVRERLDADLREGHGLTLGDYGVLVHLSEAGPDGLRMSDLADRLLLSRSGLTRRLDGLVREGLVTRRTCPNDGRGAMAQLTDKGESALTEAAPTHVAGVRRYLLGPLGELCALNRGLESIEKALAGSDPPVCRRC